MRIGFPLMLKAAAGGGGKGMRVVRDAADFREALAAARRESASAFGDQRMILERYLERPRHIEAQIFADGHGNTVHLFERDCSSQRRHQKIIEEAPAPGLDPVLRQALLTAAVRAAEAVNYRGAGTVEFLVDGDGFYFLEMNTRLQVEHPVTELITGLDLVEWQLRVAAGEPLPLAQAQINATGHAIEVRLYAEDPERGFVPSSGPISLLRLASGANIRVDRGVDAGDQVSMHYDPMIAKMIVYADHRQACLARLEQALAASMIAGPATNLGFLQALVATPVFADGQMDSGLLDRDPAVIAPVAEPPIEVVLAAAAYWLRDQEPEAVRATPWESCDGWRLSGQAARSLDLDCGGQAFRVEAMGAGGHYQLSLQEQRFTLVLKRLDESLHLLSLNDRILRLHLHERHPHALEVCHLQHRWLVSRHALLETGAAKTDGDGRLLAPMPGRILDLRVAAGETVEKSQIVLVMEAMKMELAIKAPFSGRIDQCAVAAGDLVEADTLLLSLSADPADQSPGRT